MTARASGIGFGLDAARPQRGRSRRAPDIRCLLRRGRETRYVARCRGWVYDPLRGRTLRTPGLRCGPLRYRQSMPSTRSRRRASAARRGDGWGGSCGLGCLSRCGLFSAELLEHLRPHCLQVQHPWLRNPVLPPARDRGRLAFAKPRHCVRAAEGVNDLVCIHGHMLGAPSFVGQGPPSMCRVRIP